VVCPKRSRNSRSASRACSIWARRKATSKPRARSRSRSFRRGQPFPLLLGALALLLVALCVELQQRARPVLRSGLRAAPRAME
jgi:hypothetical protein